jgi:hypothetical protein
MKPLTKSGKCNRKLIKASGRKYDLKVVASQKMAFKYRLKVSEFHVRN